jgi:D-alanine--poly(phosphoribitol) ligase subunit 1
MHDHDISVADLLARNIEAHPTRLALWAKGQTLTYGELGQRCAAVRARLAKLGLGKAPRLGIVTGDDLGTYVAIVASLLNGSTYVPLNNKAPLARNLALIRDADVAGILTSKPDALTAAAGLPVLVDPLAEVESGLRTDWPPPVPTDAAYLLFTSGSTGQPKGVPITHASLNRFMTMMIAEAGYDFSANDRVLQMFELTFDLSVMSLFLPLCIGASCHVVPDSRVGFVATLKILKEQRITVALMVPSVLAYVEQYLESTRLPDLRLSMFCGEALLERLVEKWANVVDQRPIHNWYGPTEATIFCLRYVWTADRSPRAAVNGIVPIGQPMGDTLAWLVDESGAEIEAAGVKGELVLGGRQLASGYWRNPHKTAEVFIAASDKRPAGYRTGDICFRNDDGDFVYCGRADTQVKVDGHRVELGEIEHAVRDVTGRAAVAVLAVPDGPGSSLVLFLERPEVDVAWLAAELKTRLPAYMLPRRIHTLDTLPLNSNGKLDRPKMRQLHAELGA